MNYYKESDRSEISDYVNIASLLPGLIASTMRPDKAHDSLLRCKECGIKHDIHELTRINVGHFVCRFCLRKGA